MTAAVVSVDRGSRAGSLAGSRHGSPVWFVLRFASGPIRTSQGSHAVLLARGTIASQVGDSDACGVGDNSLWNGDVE